MQHTRRQHRCVTQTPPGTALCTSYINICMSYINICSTDRQGTANLGHEWSWDWITQSGGSAHLQALLQHVAEG